jgi:AcrR family transcriptional regulator
MAPKTPKQNKAIREQTRQQIQEAAFTLFAKNGYSNTSIRAIAKAADISKGLIYHYFDSKEAILEAIFHYWVEATKYMVELSDELSAAQKMEQMITELFAFIRENPESSRLLTALALQPDAVAAIKSQVRDMTMKQITIAKKLLEKLNYDNPEIEAYYLGAKLDGITLGYLTLGEDYPLEAMKQKMLEEYVPDETD